MSASIESVSHNSSKASNISRENVSVAKEGENKIKEITNALQGLFEETNKNVQSSEELNEIASKLEL